MKAALHVRGWIAAGTAAAAASRSKPSALPRRPWAPGLYAGNGGFLCGWLNG
jgi:hypothetical protein